MSLSSRIRSKAVSVSMRLKRFGSKKRPYYRVVVMDSRAAATSRTIYEIGT